MSKPIIIAAYDPRWPLVFRQLRASIAKALGELAAAIEHVGSTAVPGLAAKPVIDIDILLSSAHGLPSAIERLTPLGYLHRGDLGIPGREAFSQPLGQHAHHLYVCTPDSVEYLRHIAFRDYLRAHPEIAKAYAELKRSLATHNRQDREKYNESKTEFVKEVLGRVFP